MKDSKLNINRAELSEKEIQNAKNFNAVLMDSKPSKTNYNKHFIVGGLLVLIGVVTAYLFLPKEGSSQINNPIVKESEKGTYKNPIKGVNVPLDSYTILVNEGKIINTGTGTIIDIPKDAFVDANGNIIQGEVELKFREFHDVPSIFSAGIPMNYDSAGVDYQFESAGMFEIKAFQNGKQVFANKDALINVALASKQAGDYFNIYLQNHDGTWDFKRKDTVGIAKVNNSALDAIQKSDVKNAKNEYSKANKAFNKTLKKGGLLSPIIANSSLYAMQLQYKTSEFPELASYKDILFEITEDNKDFDPLLASQEWDDIRLEKSITKGYKMLLFGGGKKEKLFVRPVFSAKNITAANQTFEELFVTYDTELEGRLTQEREEKDSLFWSYKNIENQYEFQQASDLFSVNNASEKDKKASTVKRVFEVEEFGMWNSDCPAKLPKGKEVEPIFVDENNPNDTLKFDIIYLAEYDKNALFTISGEWSVTPATSESEEVIMATTIGYNPKHATVIWGVTDDSKLAVFKSDKFSELNTGEGYTLMKMEIIESDLVSVEQIKKAIDWQ